MSAVGVTNWLPREIRHPGNEALPLTTRIRCVEEGEQPTVSVAFLVSGEWTPDVDWWRMVQEPDFSPAAVGALPGPGARAELEDRGWELLTGLGYLPAGWTEEGAHAFG